MFLKTQGHTFNGMLGKQKHTFFSCRIILRHEKDFQGLPGISVGSRLLLRIVSLSCFGLYEIIIHMVNYCICTNIITVAYPLMKVKLT